MARNRRTAYWCVKIPTPRGRFRWLSTGETSRWKAEEVIRTAGVDRLVMLAKVGVLTANAVALVTVGRRVTANDVFPDWVKDMGAYQSAGTIRTYSEAISEFLQGAMGRRLMRDITVRDVSDFINHPDAKISVRRVRLAAARSFFWYASASGKAPANLARHMRLRHAGFTVDKLEVKAANPFTEEEYRKIIANTTGFWRWAVILGWSLGYRMIDICCLEKRSIRTDKIMIYPKKTGKCLILPLTNPLINTEELKQTLPELLALTDDPVYCFPKQREMRLNADRRCYLPIYFGRILKNMGIPDRSFHGLRHSFKLRMDAARVPLEDIAVMMGHSHVSVTEGYGRAARRGQILASPLPIEPSAP